MADSIGTTSTIFGNILLNADAFQWGASSLLSVMVVAAVVAAISIVPIWRIAKENEGIAAVLGALFVMALFGGMVGFHGGNSRVGVVGDVIPAVVTLVAGVAAYLFGVSERKAGPLLFPMLGCFVATLFFSYSMGSANRAGGEEAALFDEQCFEVFSNADVLGSAEGFLHAQKIFASCQEFWNVLEVQG